MGQHNPKIDAYIAKAAPFARPILEELREAFHDGCPDVEERMKWSSPSFERDGMLGGMVAFKKHVGFGFWKAAAMSDPHGMLGDDPKASPMRVKVSTMDELPSRGVLVEYVQQAVRLNADGTPTPKRAAKRKPDVPSEPPDWFLDRIRANAAASATWDGFAPSYRKEYVEWVVTAKREATRERRAVQTIEWLAEGKKRNWKYQ